MTLNALNANHNVGFKGYYKVTIPNVKSAKDENEKNAYTELAINTAVFGLNNSISGPKVSNDKKSIYFHTDDKNDLNFENGIKNIIDSCNKTFNMDFAQKVYCEKATKEEYDNAISA